LKIDSVLSPSGPCTSVGPVVTCTISGLTAGASAPVDVFVTPSASTFTNTVTVTQPAAATDPVTANNKSAVTFTAAKAVVTKCVVTKVVNVPLGTAKKLLTTHGCKVGKVTKTLQRQGGQGRRDQDDAWQGLLPRRDADRGRRVQRRQIQEALDRPGQAGSRKRRYTSVSRAGP
jgi:Domain of unknown function DUF11